MALVLIASVLVAVNNIEYLKWRINETSFKKYESQADDQNGLSIRRLMWSTAWNLIKEKPLLGYGVKGARVEVVQKYREQNFMMGYTQGYHSHNQYLQSALMGGIPAVLLLLAMMLKMCWDGWRKQNTLLLVLLLHFMLQSVIESTFEVQQELVFYILFLFLFYYHPPFPDKNTEHHILRPDDHHALL